MHPTTAPQYLKTGRMLQRDPRSGLRERLEGRHLAHDQVEVELRRIALERLAQSREKRRR